MIFMFSPFRDKKCPFHIKLSLRIGNPFAALSVPGCLTFARSFLCPATTMYWKISLVVPEPPE
jgi:hypothetical protein